MDSKPADAGPEYEAWSQNIPISIPSRDLVILPQRAAPNLPE